MINLNFFFFFFLFLYNDSFSSHKPFSQKFHLKKIGIGALVTAAIIFAGRQYSIHKYNLRIEELNDKIRDTKKLLEKLHQLRFLIDVSNTWNGNAEKKEMLLHLKKVANISRQIHKTSKDIKVKFNFWNN